MAGQLYKLAHKKMAAQHLTVAAQTRTKWQHNLDKYTENRQHTLWWQQITKYNSQSDQIAELAD